MELRYYGTFHHGNRREKAKASSSYFQVSQRVLRGLPPEGAQDNTEIKARVH